MSLTGSGNENIYSFDDIVVDCENFCAQRSGHKINITPRAFDVLIFLVKNSGRVVEKQELFDNVWKDTFVSDNALTKVIKEIRHALEDPADEPRYIETVPKRGYRFIGEIKRNGYRPDVKIDVPVDNGSLIKQPRFAFSKMAVVLALGGLIAGSVFTAWLLIPRAPAAPARTSPVRSIAVLPFKPLDANSRDNALEMGMAETLITRLSNLRQVVIRPMSAVRNYTGTKQDPVTAGKEVQVEAVLDGSIQRAGDRIRVTVRLVSVHDGKPLWSGQFDENFTDIFKVQDSIAERVTNALTLELSRQEREQLLKHYTNDPEAYQLYLQGQFIWHGRRPNWIERSLASYQQALEKDPNFALAHIGIADCYIMASGHRRISMQEAEAKARPSIMKALEIDDGLAQAHNALAELKYQYEHDWTGAEKEFKKAIELNPNIAWIRQAYGWFLMSAGRFDEATVEMEKARELDPSSLTINVGRGRLFYYSRQYDEAIQHFQNIIAVEPNDASSYFSLHTIYEQKQMYPESLEAFIKFASLKGMPPEKGDQLREIFSSAGWNGLLRSQLENLEKSSETGSIDPHALADLYARLGQKDEAFKWFKKAFEARRLSAIQFKIEPAYDILRDDPRYAELVRKIGLQP